VSPSGTILIFLDAPSITVVGDGALDVPVQAVPSRDVVLDLSLRTPEGGVAISRQCFAECNYPEIATSLRSSQ